MTKTKLNVDLLKRLRTRFLRMRHKKHFNMSDYAVTTECGTAMCIAGHALQLQGYKVRGRGRYGRGDIDFISPHDGTRVDAGEAAANEMGLDERQSDELFTDFSIRTPKQAAARIQNLIKQADAR